MNSSRLIAIIVGSTLVLSLSSSAGLQEPEAESNDTFEYVQLWPIDDSHRVPSFAEFKRDLLRALKRETSGIYSSTWMRTSW